MTVQLMKEFFKKQRCLPTRIHTFYYRSHNLFLLIRLDKARNELDIDPLLNLVGYLNLQISNTLKLEGPDEEKVI